MGCLWWAVFAVRASNPLNLVATKPYFSEDLLQRRIHLYHVSVRVGATKGDLG